MRKSLARRTVAWMVAATGVGFAAGFGVGLWSGLSDDAGVAKSLAASILIAASVSGLGAGIGWWLGSRILLPSQALLRALACRPLESGGVIPLSNSDPQEWWDLADEIKELDVRMRERERLSAEHARDKIRSSRKEALRRFAEGIGREVQKPLAGVVGFTQMALRQTSLDGQLKNYLTLIDQEARIGREALERVLRTVRTEPLAEEPQNLNALLREASHSIDEKAKQAGIAIHWNLARDLPQIVGDSVALVQVFGALLENALEAVLPMRGEIEVSTNCKTDGRISVMVKDTGVGISEADQVKIFTPFFCGRGVDRAAGLNLAIAERMLELHGATIDFWSRPGEGTVFFLDFPAAQPTKASE